MIIDQAIQPKGDVEAFIQHKTGKVERIAFQNTVLRKGREALAASLANAIGDNYNFFINRMLFGENGTQGGVPKFVNGDRNGLFGPTVANKQVVATIDPNNRTQVVFTSTLTFNDANGASLNEMALQMNTEDIYSMVTFSDVNKTSSIQITFNWRLSFV